MNYVPLYLIALIVAIANTPLNIFDVHRRNVGTVHAEPWRQKLSATVARVTGSVATFLWGHRQGVAVAMLFLVMLCAPELLSTAGAICVAGQLNVAQLETDLKAKQAQAKDLLDKTMRAADAAIVVAATADKPAVTGRPMTADERGAVQAILDEAKGIKARIDGAQGDANMSAEIARLTAGMIDRKQNANDGGGRASERRSLGAQFVSDPKFRSFIEGRQHHSNGGWTSPSVETMRADLHAATFDTSAGSGGALVQADRLPGFVPLLNARVVVADLIASGTTDSNSIAYVKELAFTNAAAAVAMGATKPESTLTFEPATAAVKKIAHWMAAAREMLDDYAQTQSVIDARLRLGLELVKEAQLLNGSGVGANQLGLMNLVGLSAAQARGADVSMDAIFKQITAISIATFVIPDGFVINPANWQTIQLAKNAAGNYLGTGPWAPPQAPTLWGVTGAITPAIVSGTALVGGFRSSAQYFTKGGITVEATNSHSDFFIKNLVAILAEERGALVVYRDAAFGKVTGLN